MDQCQAWRRPCGLETIDRRNGREPRSLKEIRYYDRCCGVQYYDPERQLCCFGNRVLPKKSGDACCGSRKYNVYTELCCGFTVKKKTSSQNACCGAVPYDSRRYTCCGGTVTPRASSHQHLNSCCGYVFKQLAIFFLAEVVFLAAFISNVTQRSLSVRPNERLLINPKSRWSEGSDPRPPLTTILIIITAREVTTLTLMSVVMESFHPSPLSAVAAKLTIQGHKCVVGEKLCLPQASPHLHVVGAMFTTETNRLEQLLTRLRDNREIKIGQSSFSLWMHDKG